MHFHKKIETNHFCSHLSWDQGKEKLRISDFRDLHKTHKTCIEYDTIIGS